MDDQTLKDVKAKAEDAKRELEKTDADLKQVEKDQQKTKAEETAKDTIPGLTF